MQFVVPASNNVVVDFVSARNRARQFDFLHTSYVVSQHVGGLEIDDEFICLLNAYASRYLSQQPGRYRRHYNVTVGAHNPSDWSIVPDEMGDFIDTLHRNWARYSPTQAAAYAIWGLNHVHPFCDGNGRTARALSYYVLCQKLGLWLPGSVTIVELIRAKYRDNYCQILQRMHDGRARPAMETDLTEMTAFLDGLTLEQITLHRAEVAAAAAGPIP